VRAPSTLPVPFNNEIKEANPKAVKEAKIWKQWENILKNKKNPAHYSYNLLALIAVV
jgi:hypothetical protein